MRERPSVGSTLGAARRRSPASPAGEVRARAGAPSRSAVTGLPAHAGSTRILGLSDVGGRSRWVRCGARVADVSSSPTGGRVCHRGAAGRSDAASDRGDASSGCRRRADRPTPSIDGRLGRRLRRRRQDDGLERPAGTDRAPLRRLPTDRLRPAGRTALRRPRCAGHDCRGRPPTAAIPSPRGTVRTTRCATGTPARHSRLARRSRAMADGGRHPATRRRASTATSAIRHARRRPAARSRGSAADPAMPTASGKQHEREAARDLLGLARDDRAARADGEVGIELGVVAAAEFAARASRRGARWSTGSPSRRRRCAGAPGSRLRAVLRGAEGQLRDRGRPHAQQRRDLGGLHLLDLGVPEHLLPAGRQAAERPMGEAAVERGVAPCSIASGPRRRRARRAVSLARPQRRQCCGCW